MVGVLLAGGGFNFTGRADERNLRVLSGVAVLSGTDMRTEKRDDKVQWSGSECKDRENLRVAT